MLIRVSTADNTSQFRAKGWPRLSDSLLGRRDFTFLKIAELRFSNWRKPRVKYLPPTSLNRLHTWKMIKRVK